MPRQATLTNRLRVILVGVILLTVVVVAAVLPAAFLIRNANGALQDRWVPASDATRVLLASFVEQETGERGYIITRDEQFLTPYRRASAATSSVFARLRAHVPDDLQPVIDRLEVQYGRWRDQSEREIAATKRGDDTTARLLVAGGRGRTYFDEIRATHGRLQDRISAETARAERNVTAANQALFAAIAVGAVGVVVFALLARRLLRGWSTTVDAQQAALVELGEQTRLVEGLTRQTPDPIFLKDADGRYRFVNRGAAEVMGDQAVDFYVGRRDVEIFSAEQLPAIRRDDNAVRTEGVARDFEEAVGDRRFLVTKSPYAFGDGTIGILGVARDITHRVRSESRIVSLAVLGQAVGRESTVVGVGRAAVEPLRAATDASVIWIFRADTAGTRLEPIVDDGTRHTLRDRWQFVPVAGETLTAEAFRAAELRVADREAAAAGSPSAGIFESEDLATVAYVPLVAAGATIGMLNLAWREPRVSVVDDEESAFLRGLATVLAEALARAQATELERAAVATFQRALLPDDWFSPVLEVATRYEPALNAVAMGGDWYDVFDLAPGCLGIAVGDVVGNGIAAAAVMGRLRSALHAIAQVVDDPGEVLTHLDRFAAEVRDAAGTTVFFAVYEGSHRRLRYSCAAHPPPLVRRAGGIEQLDGARSVPLGMGLEAGPRPSATVALGPGEVLALYTDGLVERRRESIDVGIGRLAAALDGVGERPIEELADALMSALDGAGRRDDTVVVCARVRADGASLNHTVRVAAEPAQLAGLRRNFGTWLADNGTQPAVIADVMVAVTEAVSNAIEHGYGHDDTRTVVVEGSLGADLEITVRDTGRWTGQLRRPERGRGIPLMQAMMDRVDVTPSDQGTIVRMRRSRV